MKRNNLNFHICLALIVIFSTLNTKPIYSSVEVEQPLIRTNVLILNEDNFTFYQNDTIFVYLSIENIRTEILYDFYFNYSVNKDVFSIEQSSNESSSSEFVYYAYDKLMPNESFNFNMTLKIITNKTIADSKIDPFEINYKIGEFKVVDKITTNGLKINIQAVPPAPALKAKIFGFIEIDSLILIGIFLLPVILGFGFSFIFGKRQKKNV